MVPTKSLTLDTTAIAASVAVVVVVALVLVGLCVFWYKRNKESAVAETPTRLADIIDQFKFLIQDVERCYIRLKSHCFVDLQDAGDASLVVDAASLGPVVVAILQRSYAHLCELLRDQDNSTLRQALDAYARGQPMKQLLDDLDLAGLGDAEDRLDATLERLFDFKWTAWADVITARRRPSPTLLAKYKRDFAGLLKLVATVQLKRALYASVSDDAITWDPATVATAIDFDPATMDAFSTAIAPGLDGAKAWIIFPAAQFHEWTSKAIVTLPPQQAETVIFDKDQSLLGAIDALLASATTKSSSS